ncbi:class I tRNA ligase family protein [Kordia sp. YSTF-M3]|uniref:Class I tRNA ligase family protein n=1 Tax=Kordia aestuariivivens TaxID=2759037 RepID=A0ABR7QE95_9FLAO|nr:class I tRNA ligase family protein [Kordia aestuariivivens]MBC8756881.1 class I tRNA ligase family protein [Kordia aestuariivivens]
MDKYIVTIAPPTPNGDMHLGHLSGPFLAADVFTRMRRLKNDDVFFTSYSDDHQDYVASKALENKEIRFEWALKYGSRIENSLKKANIKVDWFLKSCENKYYKEAILFLLQNAIEKNGIGEKQIRVPYSFEDNQYGYEAFAKGTCNYCGSESDASQCESCANYPVLEEMGDFISIISKKPMGFVNKERMFLKISKYKDHLKELYKQNPIREHLRTFIDEVLSNENIEWFIDRPDGNGIDLTFQGKKITLHTWFSGLAGYLAASKEYWESVKQPQRHEEFWKDKNTKVVNFLGFDCSFSHAIVYPSLASNIDGFTQNFTQITNKFLKLNGDDFSTSRSHAIWVDDILEDYSSDGVRFYMALISPEEEVTNFEMKAFTDWYQNVFSPTINLIEEKINTTKTCLRFSKDEYDELELNKIDEIFSKWDFFSELQAFSIQNIAKRLEDFLQYIAELFSSGQNEKAMRASFIYVVLSKPIHPSFSERLIDKLLINENEIMDWLNSRKYSQATVKK